MTSTPEISLRFEYDTGSLPPPYHHEYSIRVQQNSGRIRYVPDYPAESTPTWEYNFDIPARKLIDLYELLLKQSVLHNNWHLEKEPMAGSDYERLEISIGSKHFSIPAYLDQTSQTRIEPVFNSVRGLVPAHIWQEIEAKQEARIQDYLNS